MTKINETRDCMTGALKLAIVPSGARHTESGVDSAQNKPTMNKMRKALAA